MYKVKFSLTFLLLLSVFLLVTLGHRYYFVVQVPNIYYPRTYVCTEADSSVREDSSKRWKTFTQALEDYKYFHRQQLSVLKNQSILHSSNPHHLVNNSVRTLIRGPVKHPSSVLDPVTSFIAYSLSFC